jgi:hypothetical protein
MSLQRALKTEVPFDSAQLRKHGSFFNTQLFVRNFYFVLLILMTFDYLLQYWIRLTFLFFFFSNIVYLSLTRCTLSASSPISMFSLLTFIEAFSLFVGSPSKTSCRF